MSGRGGYDIHGYAQRVEHYLALIAGSSTPDEDKKALTDFVRRARLQKMLSIKVNTLT